MKNISHYLLWLIIGFGLTSCPCNCPEPFTMLAYVDDTSYPDYSFKFSTQGNSGTIRVDWGDGSSDVYYLTYPQITEHQHTYGTSDNHRISVTGDLGQITFLYSFYGEGKMDEIDPSRLIGLEEIRLGLTRCPPVVDLRNSPGINSIVMPVAGNLENLILPDENRVRYIDIRGPNQITSTGVDNIIDVIHKSAVLHNETGGYFSLPLNHITPTDMIGPPSSTGIDQLKSLRDDYSWVIFPNP